MLHPVRVPPASGSLPPSDVPSGNTLGSITRRSHKCPPDMQLPRQPHVRLVVTRILRPPHPARPAGRRNPPPRFRSASPPPGSPPTPNRKEAPRPGLRHRVSCLTPCLRPPRFPSRCSGNCASGTSFVCKPPSVRRSNALAVMSAGGEYGRFQAACRRSDLIAGWAARFAAAQLAGSRASRSHGRVTGRRSMTS